MKHTIQFSWSFSEARCPWWRLNYRCCQASYFVRDHVEEHGLKYPVIWESNAIVVNEFTKPQLRQETKLARMCTSCYFRCWMIAVSVEWKHLPAEWKPTEQERISLWDCSRLKYFCRTELSFFFFFFFFSSFLNDSRSSTEGRRLTIFGHVCPFLLNTLWEVALNLLPIYITIKTCIHKLSSIKNILIYITKNDETPNFYLSISCYF